jgi:hypothetical protein
MAEDNGSEQKQGLLLDANAYAKAHRIYAQTTLTFRSEEEIAVAIGAIAPFIDPESGERPFLTDAVVYFTPEHFRRFVSAMNEQFEEMNHEAIDVDH